MRALVHIESDTIWYVTASITAILLLAGFIGLCVMGLIAIVNMNRQEG